MANADLRPMSLGEVLDRTFSLYKRNFWLFAGITSLPFLVLYVFNVGFAVFNHARVVAGTRPSSVSPALISSMIGGGLLFVILYLILVGAAQAATIFAVSDLYLGRNATIGGSFHRVRGQIGTVLGVMFLTGLLVGVGFILLIIPGIILLCRTGVSVPAAMLEDEGPADSIRRSMDLTKGFAMQMGLIYLLVWALMLVATLIFQVPFTVMIAMAKMHALSLGMVILQNLASFISQVLVAPVATIALSLMYYNLRVRKEAFDLHHLMGSLGPGSSPVSPAPGTAFPA